MVRLSVLNNPIVLDHALAHDTSIRVCVCVCVHVCACVLSHVQLFAIPWTVALQAPLSMGFSRQEYWSGLPFPPGNLHDLCIKSASPASPVLAGRFFTTESPGKPISMSLLCSCWVMSDSLWPHGLQYAKLFSPSLSAAVWSNPCPLSLWCYLIISSS